MKSFSTATFFLSSVFSTLATAGQIAFYNSGGCGDYAITVYPPPNAGIVSCGQVAGYASAQAQQVDGGCSFTVYTDSTCSVDATTAGLGACVGGASIYSYSYDCS